MTLALKTHSTLLLLTRTGQSSPFTQPMGRWVATTPVFSWQGWQSTTKLLLHASGNLMEPQWWCVHRKIGPEQPQATSYSWQCKHWARRNYPSTFCNQIVWCPQTSYWTPLSLLSRRRELDSWYLSAVRFHECRNLWGCSWDGIALFYLWDSQNQADGSQRKLQLCAHRPVSDPWR